VVGKAEHISQNPDFEKAMGSDTIYGPAVGGTEVGGTSVGGISVGGTSVGGISVGGTAVGTGVSKVKVFVGIGVLDRYGVFS
jgi:hypothetical protein